MTYTYTIDPVELGLIAYTAYGQSTDFKNFLGKPMPKWSDLPETIRNAWVQAAQAIIIAIED